MHNIHIRTVRLYREINVKLPLLYNSSFPCFGLAGQFQTGSIYGETGLPRSILLLLHSKALSKEEKKMFVWMLFFACLLLKQAAD